MSTKGCCSCCSRMLVIICFACIGVLLFVVGLILRFSAIIPNMISEQVNSNVELKPGSLVYDEWVNASTPIYMQYFVFDLKNPDEVFAGIGIPTVEQTGPYSYREIRTNEVLNWTSDKSVVTFMPNRTFIFDPETSCAGCDDKNDTFVTVNIPLLTMALWLKNTNYKTEHSFCFLGLNVEVNTLKSTLFQRKSVYDILWGYTDPLLKFAIAGSVLCPIPKGLNAFVQLQYNNTYYGISAINTGRDNINKLEQYTMWRDEPHLTWWSDNFTNMINGTDGTQFSPKVSKDHKLYGFSPEICRSFYAKYESTVTVRDITLYRFALPAELYLSGDIYPPNKGFCVPPKCLPSGLLNISLCQPMNPPIAISPPHFYHGNKSLVKAVRGLHPSESNSGTFIDVEPITGIVMRAAKRIQINVALEPVDLFTQTDGKFEPVFLPVMYANESALISKEKAAEFRHKVYLPIMATKVLEYSLIALGALFILAAVCLIIIPVVQKKGVEMMVKAEGRHIDERSPLMNDLNGKSGVKV